MENTQQTAASAPDVFLSYSHDDGEWVTKLNSALKAHGIRTFRDCDDLRGGDP
jgi:hypothetical protein